MINAIGAALAFLFTHSREAGGDLWHEQGRAQREAGTDSAHRLCPARLFSDSSRKWGGSLAKHEHHPGLDRHNQQESLPIKPGSAGRSGKCLRASIRPKQSTSPTHTCSAERLLLSVCVALCSCKHVVKIISKQINGNAHGPGTNLWWGFYIVLDHEDSQQLQKEKRDSVHWWSWRISDEDPVSPPPPPPSSSSASKWTLVTSGKTDNWWNPCVISTEDLSKSQMKRKGWGGEIVLKWVKSQTISSCHSYLQRKRALAVLKVKYCLPLFHTDKQKKEKKLHCKEKVSFKIFPTPNSNLKVGLC